MKGLQLAKGKSSGTDYLQNISTFVTHSSTPVFEEECCNPHNRTPFTRKSKLSCKIDDKITKINLFKSLSSDTSLEVRKSQENEIMLNNSNQIPNIPEKEDTNKSNKKYNQEETDCIEVKKIQSNLLINKANSSYFEDKQKQKTKTEDNAEEAFKNRLEQYQEYRKLKIQQLKKGNNYFSNSNFKNYATQDKHFDDSEDESSDNDEDEGEVSKQKESEKSNNIFEENHESTRKSQANNNVKILVNYLLPEKYFAEYCLSKSPKVQSPKNKKNNNIDLTMAFKSCPNLNNQNSVTQKYKNFVIQTLEITCEKTQLISEITTKIISDINKKFKENLINLQLKKETSLFTLRPCKKSGCPNFDLPGKLYFVFYLFLFFIYFSY